MDLKYEEEGFLTPSRIIIFSFLGIVAFLLGNYIKILFTNIAYLFIANRALIQSGLHNPRKKLRKKDLTNWSYGD